MSGSDITQDAEAMEIIRKLRERGYTGSVVAQAMSRIDADEVKLTEAQISTLREMVSYPAGRYFFRQATCRSLVDMGLADKLRIGLKRSPHAITPAGRAALAKSRETE